MWSAKGSSPISTILTTAIEETVFTEIMATRPLMSQVDIPLCVPAIYGNEWKYVKECLDTNWASYVGPFVGRFEEAVAKYGGTKYAVATVSGTAALHTALLVAGVESDD